MSYVWDPERTAPVPDPMKPGNYLGSAAIYKPGDMIRLESGNYLFFISERISAIDENGNDFEQDSAGWALLFSSEGELLDHMEMISFSWEHNMFPFRGNAVVMLEGNSQTNCYYFYDDGGTLVLGDEQAISGGYQATFFLAEVMSDEKMFLFGLPSQGASDSFAVREVNWNPDTSAFSESVVASMSAITGYGYDNNDPGTDYPSLHDWNLYGVRHVTGDVFIISFAYRGDPGGFQYKRMRVSLIDIAQETELDSVDLPYSNSGVAQDTGGNDNPAGYVDIQPTNNNVHGNYILESNDGDYVVFTIMATNMNSPDPAWDDSEEPHHRLASVRMSPDATSLNHGLSTTHDGVNDVISIGDVTMYPGHILGDEMYVTNSWTYFEPRFVNGLWHFQPVVGGSPVIKFDTNLQLSEDWELAEGTKVWPGDESHWWWGSTGDDLHNIVRPTESGFGFGQWIAYGVGDGGWVWILRIHHGEPPPEPPEPLGISASVRRSHIHWVQ